MAYPTIGHIYSNDKYDMKFFIVAVIYICTNGGFVCPDEPITKVWRLENEKDPFDIKEKCEKWISDKMWNMKIESGQIAQGKCVLQLLKEE